MPTARVATVARGDRRVWHAEHALRSRVWLEERRPVDVTPLGSLATQAAMPKTVKNDSERQQVRDPRATTTRTASLLSHASTA